MAVKKLIEVALPLDAINEASAREKSIRHGHPSTLHLWWARRPLAAARAVIWASLVDDPSSHPDRFPTEEAQTKERERLFGILEELVVWENSNNQRVLDAAKAEIRRSMGEDLPPLLDPFAGGGAIPLEAQRLGLEAYAQDLNPVAVTINKAMIEIPPKFAGKPAVNPESRKRSALTDWSGNAGLAADVEYYGNWMKEEAFRRIGHLYPQVDVPREQGGGKATVIAWIWARTVKCPNPACGCEMPLVNSFELSKKKGNRAWVVPKHDPIDNTITYSIASGDGAAPTSPKVSKGQFKCIACGNLAPKSYIHEQFQKHRHGCELIGVVAEGNRRRIFLSPDKTQIKAAMIDRPDDYPTQSMNSKCTDLVSGRGYGFEYWHELFTNRQLTALATYSSLVSEAQDRAYRDALAGGREEGLPIADGGLGAKAYGEAIGVYLAFAVSKMTDRCSTQCGWDASPNQLSVRNVFGRQAIPMTWDYAETNPFSGSTGSFLNMLEWIVKCFSSYPNYCIGGTARQFEAQSDNGMRGIAVSTDPPYYDNINYADLSDFFYVWLRQSLKRTYPKLFNTMLVPKKEELIAAPYREDRGPDGARCFFEEGMYCAFQQVYRYSCEEVPVTIYYAFKQSETETVGDSEQTASTGWETMLSAIVRAGFAITGTWPMRTEMANRNIASGTNALASSIVLVCRKRSEDAPMATRRDFVNTLKRELKPALEALQTSNIAPVDLAQSAIGPGIGVYSRFSKVLEADGSQMTVRAALQIINQELDLYFADQDGDLDRESRFCVDLYTQSAFNDMKFGEADVLARAKNTSIEGLAAKGALVANKGIVHLKTREEISLKDRPDGFTWLLTQQLTRAMETGGVEACASLVKDQLGSAPERAKALAYRLFTIAEKKGWQQEAFAYNALVVAWPDIQSKAAMLHKLEPTQTTLGI